MKASRIVLVSLVAMAVGVVGSADAQTLLFTLDTPNPQAAIDFGWTVAVGDVNGDSPAGRAYIFAASTTDADGDGIPDGEDDCPLIPGDPGPPGNNGCPMSDISIVVDKDEEPDVDASVETPYPVYVTVTNGDDAADVDVHLLLISEHPFLMTGCTISWVDEQPGLHFMEEFVGDKRHSHLSGTLSMAADEVVVLDLTAYIHCFERSLHVDAFELDADAAPVPPVWDDNPATNTQKNWPDVTVWEYADVKIITQYVDSPPTDIDVSQDVVIDLVKVIHNNGYYGPVDAQVNNLASADPDCAVTPGSDSEVVYDIPVSTDVVLHEPFTIHCDATSSHSFYFDNELTVLPEHVVDPVPVSNSVSTTLTVNVIVGASPPVGGIAELPDADASAGRNYIAVATLAAAAVIALSAGAWYGRRRFSRS